MITFTFHIIKLNVLSALMICLTMLLGRITRKHYALQWKYWIWLLTALLLLFPINTSSISAVHLQVNAPVRSLTHDTPTARMQADAAVTSDVPPTPASSHGETIVLSNSTVSVYGLLQLFAWIWPIGAIILGSSRILRYRFSLWHLQRWSCPVADPDILRLYREIYRSMQIRRPPKLLTNSRLTTPVLAGLCETRLYLTDIQYPSNELAFILRHELTHYQHRDLWYKLLLLIVSTVYWFNPVLLLMRNEAEKDIENLCDSRVVRHFSRKDRLAYGQLLLKTAALQNHVPYLSTGLNDSKLVFKERIHYLARTEHLHRRFPPAILIGIGLIAGNILVGCSSGQTDTNFNAVTAQSDDTPLSTPTETPHSITTTPSGQKAFSRNLDAKETEMTVYTGTDKPVDTTDDAHPSSSDSNTNYTAPMDTTHPVTTDTPSAPVEDPGAPDSSTVPDAPSQDVNTGENNTPDNEISTVSQQTLYAESGSNGTISVSMASDGSWQDASGQTYTMIAQDLWKSNSDQSIWTDIEPKRASSEEDGIIQIQDPNTPHRYTLYYDTANGNWQTLDGRSFTQNADGTFSDSYGNSYPRS